MGASRRSAPVIAERPLPEPGTTAADLLAAQIAAALDEAGGKRLPVYATLGDALVRYFIVTPPGNSARMQDLRAAASVRFQVLYGESAASWQIVADWQATTPFLACAVPQRLCVALQLAVATQRGTLVSMMPDFVAAWNRSRRHLGAHAWLATLSDGALTLGLVADADAPQLVAVRTLVLPEVTPSLTWLREQVARAALLDNVPAPSVLYVHGRRVDGWSTGAASMTSSPTGATSTSRTPASAASTSHASTNSAPASADSMSRVSTSPASTSVASTSSESTSPASTNAASTISASSDAPGMSVRWCAPGTMPAAPGGHSVSTAAQLAWGGVTR
jgi:hypothetical protein